MTSKIVGIDVVEEGLAQQMQRLANFEPVATKVFANTMHHAAASARLTLISDIEKIGVANRSAMQGMIGSDITPLAPVSTTAAAKKILATVTVAGPVDVIGVIGSHTKGNYLSLVEQGRGPGKHPPAIKLQNWAERNLGVVPKPARTTKKGKVIRDLSVGRALAHAIAEKGIKGSPVLEKATENSKARVEELFGQALVEIAKELGFT